MESQVPPSPKKQPKFRKENIKTFLKTDRAILMICISIAFVFWLMTKLSYSYKDSVVIQLAYQTPEDKVFTFPPANQLDVNIEGKGWDLLGIAFSNEKRVVTIPVSENENRTISVSSLTNKVMPFIPDVNILSIYPESIDLKTEDMAKKTIPIILEEEIQLAALYQYVDSLQIEPQFVEIKGPASVIRDIHSWKTNLLIPPSKVDKNIEEVLELASHPNTNISFSTNKVICKAAVEAVTEKEIDVPIQVLNAPDSLLLVILPKKIKVSCRVGLSDYDKLTAKQFVAVVDFKQVNLYKERSIRVLLKERPQFVKQVQYSPKKVDYIIRSRNL